MPLIRSGKVMAAFCAQLAEQAGYFIDFNEVSREEMYAAMIASFRGEKNPLVSLLGRICAMIE